MNVIIIHVSTRGTRVLTTLSDMLRSLASFLRFSKNRSERKIFYDYQTAFRQSCTQNG